MSTNDPVKLEIDRGLAVVCMDSPETRNALSFRMMENLSFALKLIANDSEAKVAVLTAAGGVFSAGMDLKTVNLDDVYEAAKFADTLAEVYRDLLQLPVPLICAVDGKAMGGAVGLALAGDLVFAGPSAEFSFPETRSGLVPALVSVVARRRIPAGQLSGLALTGIAVDAKVAVRVGIADSLAETTATKDALKFARKIQQENSREAMRRTKAFLTSQTLTTLDEELALACHEFQIAVTTPAAKHGLKGFREKRPIVWSEGFEDPE